MLTATLGGLIKDFRIKKRLSQQEVSLHIGWRDTSRLSKIEQGRVGKPTRETIDRVINAFGLTKQEKGEFLFVGGYLPTEEEILEIKQKTDVLLNDWIYPSMVIDFSWRVINQNKATLDVYQINTAMNKRISKNHMRVLEILFDPVLIQNKLIKNKYREKWLTFLFYVVLQFKNEQRDRIKEKWYIQHLNHLLQNDLFREIWTQTQTNPETEILVSRFAIKSIVHPQDPNKILNFYMFIVPVIEDPRFGVEMLVPMDKQTFEYYHQ